ncbi:hypothetical protein SLEP1_g6366 [Rubroshorea leprosula]|uniref:Uncharacterized protein n=1 Tax=Rubroshorea leprosula TaxID=152421 RepID=A0AAV5I1B0_9ROSI|nr:hypothetical protein SLEP1_g6366 [Rubroshorea leprosula]
MTKSIELVFQNPNILLCMTSKVEYTNDCTTEMKLTQKMRCTV